MFSVFAHRYNIRSTEVQTTIFYISWRCFSAPLDDILPVTWEPFDSRTHNATNRLVNAAYRSKIINNSIFHKLHLQKHSVLVTVPKQASPQRPYLMLSIWINMYFLFVA